MPKLSIETSISLTSVNGPKCQHVSICSYSAVLLSWIQRCLPLLLNKNIKDLLLFFLEFSGYTIRATREMNDVVVHAALEFGCQGSTDRPHFSCSFVKGALL